MDLDKTHVVGDLLRKITRQRRYLVVTTGPLEGRYVPVEAEPLLIGRARDAGLTLPDPAASGSHCSVRMDGPRMIVQDLGSTNGTFVDETRIEGSCELRAGSVLQVGHSLFRHELLAEDEVRRREQMATELRKAASYVQSLLPSRLPEGPVRTDWKFVPSMELGGDAFGHHELDDGRFALYLLDVSGHGAGAALHSVSAMNIVEKQSLPGVDFGQPAQVLGALNRSFPMEKHGNMFFTMWYGVFDPSTRKLSFASAGHPPALLIPEDRKTVVPLRTKNLPIGIADEVDYLSDVVDVPPASRLYLFSDGTFEVRTSTGEMMTTEEFTSIVAAPTETGVGEPERIERTVRLHMSDEHFEDDFSLLCVEFE